MADGTVIIDTRFDDKPLQKGVKDLEKSMDKAAKNMDKWGKGLSKNVTAPILAATTGLAMLSLNVGNYADSVLDAADATALSTDEIQRWEHVTKRAGVSTDAMTNAAAKLNREWSSIRKGSGSSAAAIDELKLSLDDLDAMTADERLNTLVRALADVEDPAERARIGSDLFGRQWDQVAPIVGMGADELDNLKDSYNGVMTPDDLKKANDFRIEWEMLKEEMMLAGRTIAMDLMPVFTDVLIPIIQDQLIPLISRFAQYIARLGERFMELDPRTQNMIVAMVALAAALGPLLIISSKLILAVKGIIAIFTVANVIIFAKIAAIGLLVAAIVYLWKTNETFRDIIKKIWEQVADIFSATFELIMALIDVFVMLATALWNIFGDTIIAITKSVFGYISGVIEASLKVILGILDVFIGLFTLDFERMGQGIRSIASGIFGFLQSGFQLAFDVILGAANVFSSALVLVFRLLNKAIRAPLNGIIALCNGVIGGFERMINGVARAINAIPSISIPRWVPGLGGNSFGIPNVPTASFPRIPQLATGTDYVPDDMLAVIHKGEQVVPKKYNPHANGNGGGMAAAINIIIESMQVRDDDDIERIATELQVLLESKNRGLGVVF